MILLFKSVIIKVAFGGMCFSLLILLVMKTKFKFIIRFKTHFAGLLMVMMIFTLGFVLRAQISPDTNFRGIVVATGESCVNDSDCPFGELCNLNLSSGTTAPPGVCLPLCTESGFNCEEVLPGLGFVCGSEGVCIPRNTM